MPVAERAELDAVTGPPALDRAARHPQHASALGPGTRLGKYQIQRQLGAGGMSTVWEARDTELDRRVALKLLSAGDRVLMLREARAMAQVNHPNVVAVYDVGSHEGSPFVVTELLEGESLRERLRAGPL